MKAMVFAAGVGSRLKEFTAHRPKCLMDVAGVTMLERVVERLKEVGVSEIAINLHHYPEQVEEFVKSRKEFGIRVLFSREEELLDTGGGLKKLKEFFASESAFLIHNSDIYSSVDLKTLVSTHDSHSSIGTLAVMKRCSSRGLYLDSESQLVGWTGEKTAPAPASAELFAFCGISAASGELFDYMDDRERFSLIEPYLLAARKTGRVRGHVVVDAEWTDIGTPEQLATLQRKLA
jgi:NDP-sugar pyrophosphorylase family protein